MLLLFMELDGLSTRHAEVTRNQQFMVPVPTMTGKTDTHNSKLSYLVFSKLSNTFAIESGVFIFV